VQYAVDYWLAITGGISVGASPTTLRPLNSFWVGHELGYLEQLSIQSALYHGHRFRLFSYDPDSLRGVPSGVELHDASEVMPKEKLISYAGAKNGVALGANLWRYHMLARGLGYWCDLDCVLLRPFDFPDPYVLGWEYEGWVNNAVMLAPADSEFVKDLLELMRPNVRPPWFGPRRSLNFYIERWRRGHVGLEDFEWGTYSVGLVTHIVRKRRLERFVHAPETFYPISWSEARLIFGDPEIVNAKISSNTRAVHMWNSRIADLKTSPPPSGSWIALQCEHYGLDCSTTFLSHESGPQKVL
jgi:hypothetical protein